MFRLFLHNGNLFYAENSYVEKNTFLNQPANTEPTPEYNQNKDKLPEPVWEGHSDTVDCYNHVVETAFNNFKTPNPESGLISPFIDTAFNGNLFMWDSAFNVMYGKYFKSVADFQVTLDNFYARQHDDGFICRELSEEEPGDRFSRDDPGSTGPNIIPWAEWEYYCSTNNKERLSKVFDPLCGYYKWLMDNRAWQDGSYWSSGLACGMDNQPRQAEGYDPMVSHGYMSWIDMCAQQYLSAQILIKMAKELDRESEVSWLKEEAELLYNIVNKKMWSEKDGFYYDTRRDGSHSGVKTIGAYWTLLAGLVPEERKERFVAHLNNEKEFKRAHRIPALSFDHPEYKADGGYFCGGVWPQTNYMVLSGLRKCGYEELAYEIACNHVHNVTEVFSNTGAVYENYAPEKAEPGNPAKAGYVGWAGLGPVSVLFEYVFGIIPDAVNRKITWRINRLEKHGVLKYPLGNTTVDLICNGRKSQDEEPEIQIKSEIPLTVEIIWNGKRRIING
ncbi:MAG: glycoside hydrolase [Clostridia bacterium]|nr:glycoside hydrolase [Clostridia bacterium]